MKGKLLGIFGLLVALCVFMTFKTADPWYDISTSTFLKIGNIQNLLSRIALYGILGVGVSFVIITSGIDLSVGSMVCFSGVLLAIFLHVDYVPEIGGSVTEITADENRIELAEALPELKPGDRFRFSGGRKASTQMLTIDTVEGSSVTTKENLKRSDKQGSIAVASPLVSVERLTADDESGFKVVLQGQHPLAANDQLNLAHPTSGFVVDKVIRADVGEDTTTVFLRNDPGDRVTSDWLAIPVHRQQRMPVLAALVAVLAIAVALGLVHGLLVTRARLQPFVVTLCGLLIYRGLSRWMTSDNPAGFGEYADGLCQLGSGRLDILTTANGDTFGIPYPFFILVGIGIAAAIFLNRTIYGRYLLALGRNEEAARFSGIDTRKVTLMAYVICTTLAAVGGMLFSLDSLSISPSSFGNFFELYAIAAAVLGGCSLRGGEGSISGVIIGTAVMQVLNNMIILLDVSATLEYAIIGSVILIGVLADEFFKSIAARRKPKV